MTGFDPAAEFLLDMGYLNLFEPASALATNTNFRCKGCTEIVPSHERERHHKQHLREREQQKARRRDQLRKQQAETLRRAREKRAAA